MKEKHIGHYKISLLEHSSNSDLAQLKIWSAKLGSEVHNTGMTNKSKVEAVFSKLNSVSKIDSYLGNKIRMASSPIMPFRY